MLPPLNLRAEEAFQTLPEDLGVALPPLPPLSPLPKAEGDAETDALNEHGWETFHALKKAFPQANTATIILHLSKKVKTQKEKEAVLSQLSTVEQVDEYIKRLATLVRTTKVELEMATELVQRMTSAASSILVSIDDVEATKQSAVQTKEDLKEVLDELEIVKATEEEALRQATIAEEEKAEVVMRMLHMEKYDDPESMEAQEELASLTEAKNEALEAYTNAYDAYRVQKVLVDRATAEIETATTVLADLTQQRASIETNLNQAAAARLRIHTAYDDLESAHQEAKKRLDALAQTADPMEMLKVAGQRAAAAKEAHAAALKSHDIANGFLVKAQKEEQELLTRLKTANDNVDRALHSKTTNIQSYNKTGERLTKAQKMLDSTTAQLNITRQSLSQLGEEDMETDELQNQKVTLEAGQKHWQEVVTKLTAAVANLRNAIDEQQRLFDTHTAEVQGMDAAAALEKRLAAEKEANSKLAKLTAAVEEYERQEANVEAVKASVMAELASKDATPGQLAAAKATLESVPEDRAGYSLGGRRFSTLGNTRKMQALRGPKYNGNTFFRFFPADSYEYMGMLEKRTATNPPSYEFIASTSWRSGGRMQGTSWDFDEMWLDDLSGGWEMENKRLMRYFNIHSFETRTEGPLKPRPGETPSKLHSEDALVRCTPSSLPGGKEAVVIHSGLSDEPIDVRALRIRWVLKQSADQHYAEEQNSRTLGREVTFDAKGRLQSIEQYELVWTTNEDELNKNENAVGYRTNWVRLSALKPMQYDGTDGEWAIHTFCPVPAASPDPGRFGESVQLQRIHSLICIKVDASSATEPATMFCYQLYLTGKMLCEESFSGVINTGWKKQPSGQALRMLRGRLDRNRTFRIMMDGTRRRSDGYVFKGRFADDAPRDELGAQWACIGREPPFLGCDITGFSPHLETMLENNAQDAVLVPELRKELRTIHPGAVCEPEDYVVVDGVCWEPRVAYPERFFLRSGDIFLLREGTERLMVSTKNLDGSPGGTFDKNGQLTSSGVYAGGNEDLKRAVRVKYIPKLEGGSTFIEFLDENNSVFSVGMLRGAEAFATVRRVSHSSSLFQSFWKYFEQKDRIMRGQGADRKEQGMVDGGRASCLEVLDVFKVEYPGTIQDEYRRRVQQSEWDCPHSQMCLMTDEMWEEVVHPPAYTLEDENGVRVPSAQNPNFAAPEMPLNKDRNEKVLFHGTAPDNLTGLVESVGYNFVHRGEGLYGSGLYMAEEPGKADEYTRTREGTQLFKHSLRAPEHLVNKTRLDEPPILKSLLPGSKTEARLRAAENPTGTSAEIQQKKAEGDVRYLLVFRAALGCVAVTDVESWYWNRGQPRHEKGSEDDHPLVLLKDKLDPSDLPQGFDNVAKFFKTLYPGMEMSVADKALVYTKRQLNATSAPIGRDAPWTDLNPMQHFHSLMLSRFVQITEHNVESFRRRVIPDDRIDSQLRGPAEIRGQQWRARMEPKYQAWKNGTGRPVYASISRYNEFVTFNELQAMPIAIVSYVRRRAAKNSIPRNLTCPSAEGVDEDEHAISRGYRPRLDQQFWSWLPPDKDPQTDYDGDNEKPLHKLGEVLRMPDNRPFKVPPEIRFPPSTAGPSTQS